MGSRRRRKPGLAARVSASESRVPSSSQAGLRPLARQSAAARSRVSACLEVVAFGAQPAGQFAPLAQQAFQRHLDDDLAVAGVLDQQPFLHERVDQGVAGGGQVGVAGNRRIGWSLSGLMVASHGINASCSKSAGPAGLVGVGGQQVVDLGLHHLGHPAHRLVLGQPDSPVAVVAGRAAPGSAPAAAACRRPRRSPAAAARPAPGPDRSRAPACAWPGAPDRRSPPGTGRAALA